MSKALWVVQALLAVVFLFAGGVKLLTPPAVLAAQMALPIPIWFIQFIGVCEVLGAVGLILPAALKIRPGLTPLAAAGLVVIMIGATTITAATMGVAMAIMPFVVGVLAAFVAFGRTRLAPQVAPMRAPQLDPAI